jgi:hypothetical protein
MIGVKPNNTKQTKQVQLMDNTSGTPRKRKLASSNVPLRAWDHILENCTPLSSTSHRRSPVKVVPPHTEYPPTLDAYAALERGVRELLLPETTSEIDISNLFTTGTRCVLTCGGFRALAQNANLQAGKYMCGGSLW